MKNNNSHNLLVFAGTNRVIICTPEGNQKQYLLHKNGVNGADFGAYHRFLHMLLKKYCDAACSILLVADTEYSRIREEYLTPAIEKSRAYAQVSERQVQRHYQSAVMPVPDQAVAPEGGVYRISYRSEWDSAFQSEIIDKLAGSYSSFKAIAMHEWLALKNNISEQLVMLVKSTETVIIKYEASKPILLARLKNRGIKELTAQIAHCFEIPKDIAVKLYLNYGNVLLNKNLKDVVIDIPLPESQVREVVLSDLIFLIQQYFIGLFKAAGIAARSKQIGVHGSELIVYGKHVNHMRLGELASLYFSNDCRLAGCEYEPDFGVFGKITASPINTALADNTEAIVQSEPQSVSDDLPAETAIKKPFLNRMIQRIRSEWQFFINEPEKGFISLQE